jgi:hypothetical protein
MANTALRRALALSTALGGAWLGAAAACAEDAADAEAASSEAIIVTAQHTTRSSVLISGEETQKLLPGISPLKAIASLPGVIYETADPWGNNEQNESLIVHGLTTQQLGYTMDGVPLGDQQYGNYNGLSPSRAVSSENVDNVVLSSGAGALGVASTSNLGGAIETFSRLPGQERQVDVRQTLGSYDTTRTFVRLDTGVIGDGNTAYASYLHQDARAWDFDGHQKGDQVNAAYQHTGNKGVFTWYGDWQQKVEPNEDATLFGTQQASTSTYFPYTRPFIYPDITAGLAYLNANGAPPAQFGNNFSNYFSAAQRADALTYFKFDWKLADDLTWSNQPYYHYDYGRGIVAGPVNQAGLPGLFAIYFPGQNLVNVFGGTGYEVRTTEYRINRGGLRSTLNWQLGDHAIEAGLWYEHNESAQHRVWYPFAASSNDQTPYDIPVNYVFTQYYFELKTDDVQLHLQDQWRITPNLLLQAGWKASLQTAGDEVKVQQKNAPCLPPPGTCPVQTNYPTGSLTSNDWFLPEVGATWDVDDHDQLFFNVQKNMRQFVVYGAGSNFYATSPWSLGSQQAFDDFKATGKPETSWVYEVGARTRRSFNLGPLTGIDGQINYYHVDFSNRMLNVATFNFINPNPAILVNVGGVAMDGADVAATLHFGEHLSLYDALSYNNSTYQDDYQTVAGGVQTTVPLAGKHVPLQPDWLNRFIVATNWGPFDAQLSSDYLGRRPVTYLNDLSVKSQFLLGLQAGYTFEAPLGGRLKEFRLSVNGSNLTNHKGISTAVVTSNTGGYQGFPIPPSMWFVTLSTKF